MVKVNPEKCWRQVMVRMRRRGLYTSGFLIGIFSCFLAFANIWEITPLFVDPSLASLLSSTESSFLMSFNLHFY